MQPVVQPVECFYTQYNRLFNRLSSRFDNRLCRVNRVLDRHHCCRFLVDCDNGSAYPTGCVSVCLCVCVFAGDVVILRIELSFDVRYSLLLLPAAFMNF